MTIINNNEIIFDKEPCCDIFKDFSDLEIIRYEKTRAWSIRISIPLEIIDDFDSVFGSPKRDDVPVMKIKYCPFCGVNLKGFYGI